MDDDDVTRTDVRPPPDQHGWSLLEQQIAQQGPEPPANPRPIRPLKRVAIPSISRSGDHE